MDQLQAVVLAAGEGKRMHSKLPKVLHPLCGKPMINYILESAADLTDNVTVVIGHGASQVKEALGDSWNFVLQEEQLGTGHAVFQAIRDLPAEGSALILCGDTPLLEALHLKELVGHKDSYAAVVATTELPDPAGYGRIVRDRAGLIKEIIEEKDASEEVKNISEINTGTYYFDLALLNRYLPMLKTENAQNEYYLTDVLALMRRDGHKVGAYPVSDYRIGLGINNRAQLAEAERLLREKINHSLMLSGVTMVDASSTYIDFDVQIKNDTVILPGCIIEKATIIGSGCRIGPYVHLSAAVINDGAVVQSSVICGSVIESEEKVGPFEYIAAENQRFK